MDVITQEARLRILQELARQVDGRLNETALGRVLDTYGIRRPSEWVRTQLRALEQLDAIAITEVGTVMVAALRRLGRDHVERRVVIDGVDRPADD
jgi:hypothetical protein